MTTTTVHPNAVVLPAPFKVSPFIRFCRFAALGAGIIYGTLRFSYLKRKHRKVREREHEEEVQRDYQNYRQTQINNRENVAQLLQNIGLEFNEDMKKQFGVSDVK